MTNRRKFLQYLGFGAAAPFIAKGDLTPENMQVSSGKVRVKSAATATSGVTAGAWFTATTPRYRSIDDD